MFSGRAILRHALQAADFDTILCLLVALTRLRLGTLVALQYKDSVWQGHSEIVLVVRMPRGYGTSPPSIVERTFSYISRDTNGMTGRSLTLVTLRPGQ